MRESASVLALVIQVAVKLTLLLSAVALMDAALLRRYVSAAARHLVWTCAIVGALLLPLLGGVLPALRVRIATERAMPLSVLPNTPAPQRIVSDVKLVAPTMADQSTSESAHVPARISRDDRPATRVQWKWGAMLVIAYLSGVVIVLLKLFVEQEVVRTLVRHAAPANGDVWTNALTAAATRLKVRRPVRLLQSPTPILPLTTGILRPLVVLPSEADLWTAERREAVLLHELGHVRREDCLTQTIAAVACAFYWPHPLAWWAAARLRVERELACDDLVIANGVAPFSYAEHLLEIARSLGAPRPTPTLAVGMAAPSQLERRLRAVIDDTRRRGGIGARSVTAVGFATLAVIAPLSAAVIAAADAPAIVSPRGAASLPAPSSMPAPTVATPAPHPASAPKQPSRRGGEFIVRLTTEQEGAFRPGLVHFSLLSPGLNTFYVDPRRLDGLSMDQLRSPTGELHFTLKRDAGALAFVGAMRGDNGRGRFEFIPDSSYVESLIRRGIGRLTPQQQFIIGLHDVPLALLDELAAQGYATPTTNDVVQMSMSSVDLAYLREMDAVGYRIGSLPTLIYLYNVGVTPQFIRSIAATSGRKLSIGELLQIRMRDEAARGERSRGEAAQASGTRLPPIDGDSPLNGRWAIARRPDGSLKLDIEWADVNQWSRTIALAELGGLTQADLDAAGPSRVAFHYDQDAGRFEFQGTFSSGHGSGDFTFSPNHGFATTLRDAGIRELDHVSNHDLKNLGFAGMSASNVRELIALGLRPMTKDELLDLAVRQVTPEYVRALQAAGVRGADSVQAVVDLRFHNFPPAYASDLRALGYKSIPRDQLLEMYGAGVTPNFIRRLQAAGERDLTPEQLVELRRRR